MVGLRRSDKEIRRSSSEVLEGTKLSGSSADCRQQQALSSLTDFALQGAERAAKDQRTGPCPVPTDAPRQTTTGCEGAVLIGCHQTAPSSGFATGFFLSTAVVDVEQTHRSTC